LDRSAKHHHNIQKLDPEEGKQVEYQVWTEEYKGGNWGKVDCGDREAVMREIDKAVRDG